MSFRLSIPCLLALFWILLAGALPARASDTLRVCLDENIPPLSSKRENEARGFDLAVAQAVASRLGREIAIQWFESEVDKDSILPWRRTPCSLMGVATWLRDIRCSPAHSARRKKSVSGCPTMKGRHVKTGNAGFRLTRSSRAVATGSPQWWLCWARAKRATRSVASAISRT